MKRINPTREEMWSLQQISPLDIDYEAWEKKRLSIQSFSKMSHSPIFTVDVYKGVYDFASESFSDLFGINNRFLKSIHRQGDLLEDMIHPDDREILIGLQVKHSQFIYSLSPEQRNDFRTVYQFRMRNSRKEYINVISRQQVLEKDSKGKAWIIMGTVELSPDQMPAERVKCSVMNMKTGIFFNPDYTNPVNSLTNREIEILKLVKEGFLSKEIASKLNISTHTVNNHRKNILSKLDVDNSFEAINCARTKGII